MRVVLLQYYNKTKKEKEFMFEDEVKMIEVPEPKFRRHYSEYNPLEHRDPGEVMREIVDKNAISDFLQKYPKIVVISATGILGDVKYLCQTVNPALFHLWYEDLAIHSTDIHSYDSPERPLNVESFLRSMSGNGFMLHESFARYAGKKMINACCFSFVDDTNEGWQEEQEEFPYSIIDGFGKSSFTRVNITCSLHQVKEGELFRVDVIDLDGRVDAEPEHARLLFLPEGYTVSIPLLVHS